ncbi:replication protein A 70 kDa DNA-binding subunit D-like [Forsythia ovata]|uniref:Replication protein A 70 kDa DNA-binding subunit D-like n=1 Tax=Forsythia ovata TaxID=205694 RepID=A0ABD1S074_9LAMI
MSQLHNPTLLFRDHRQQRNGTNQNKHLNESTVQVTLYDHNITAFQDKLILGKTYLVSNALVKLKSADYRAKSGEVQWTILGRTRVRHIEENRINLLMSTYSFTGLRRSSKIHGF